MFIRNNKRFSIDASQEINGVRYPHFRDPALRESLGITEIPDPTPPTDFESDIYYETDQDTAPFKVWTRKPDAQISQAKWSKIKVRRDDLTENGGCLLNGKWFHTDTKSKQQQMALTILGASIPTGTQWKTMDGTFVMMTQTLAGQLFAAQVAREQAIFVIAETKRSALPLGDVNAGWPERYVAP